MGSLRFRGKSGGAVELTGDALVTDVLDGKFFYSDDAEAKLEGTLALTGDAVVADVANGKTFYKDDAKTKLTGTSTAVETGDANAAAGDIASGKTAYVNGSKITGSASLNPFNPYANLVPMDNLTLTFGHTIT